MLAQALQEQLLDIAVDSIRCGLEQGHPLPVDSSDYPASLQQAGACFVTLHRRGELRGCIGMLEALRPLVVDVAENAYAAAFRDPRFAPLAERELAGLELQISILSPSSPLAFSSEDDLIRQLQVGVDGLILSNGPHRGTFLPSVWESLPEPGQFLRQLKRKAGLAPDYWSESITLERYHTQSFSRKVNA